VKKRYTILWAYWPNKEYFGKLPVISDGTRLFIRWQDRIKKSEWWIEIDSIENQIIKCP